MKQTLSILILAYSFTTLSQGGFGPGGEGGEVIEGEKAKSQSARCGTDRNKVDCNEVLEFDESTQKVYHSKTGKPFTGTCESCYDNGKQENIASFKDGKEDGRSTSFYEDGNKQSERGFVYGVEEGEWKYWFSEKDGGKLAWINIYSQGKKNGQWIWYYKDGTERKIENYKMDNLDGLATKYWSPGKVKSEIMFKDGNYNGTYKTFHRNGQLSIETNYSKGKEDGLFKHYYESAQISKEGEWKNGIKTGKWTSFYKSGTDRTIENFVNGKLEGKRYEYFEEGKIKKDETYKNGVLYEQTLFDAYGNMVNEDGKKITQEDVDANNNILRATAEAREKNGKKKKRGKGYDFSSVDQEFMCGCIQAERSGEEESEECKKAKKEFSSAMGKADKKTQKKMRKLIAKC